MTDETATSVEDAGGVAVNPFAFFPNQASRIRGLGGREAPNDPAYAFHTPYLFCKPGKVVFSFHCEGLQATSGNLTIRVHSISTAPGASPQTVKMLSKQLVDWVEEDGRMDVSFAAKPGTMYAVVGVIYGTSDASATAMSTTLDRPDDGTSVNHRLAQTRYTEFGATVRSDMSRLQSDDRATLSHPVSQLATASQFDERCYDAWLAEAGMKKVRHRKQWELVYILQTLSVYGMIQPKARGLGFGGSFAPGSEMLPQVLAARGCEIVATEIAAAGLARLAGDGSAAPEPDDLDGDQMAGAPAIHDNLRDFDFCWSAGLIEHLGNVSTAYAFIARSLDCLKVGGFAVHTTEIDLATDLGSFDTVRTLPMRRRDFERLALDLIADGHHIAQFKYDPGKAPLDPEIDAPPFARGAAFAPARAPTTSCGIIIQKGEA